MLSFNFVINYRLGRLNGKADILSKLDQHRFKKGGDKDQPIKTVLNELHFAAPPLPAQTKARLSGILIFAVIRLNNIPAARWVPSFVTSIKDTAKDNEEYQQHLTKPAKYNTIEDGLLYHIYTLWIPDDADLKRTILESEYNNKVAGYIGVAKTSDLICKNF